MAAPTPENIQWARIVTFGSAVLIAIIVLQAALLKAKRLVTTARSDAEKIKEAAHSEARQTTSAAIREAQKTQREAQEIKKIAEREKKKAIAAVAKTKTAATLDRNDSASICSSLTTGEDGNIATDDSASSTDSYSNHENVDFGDAGSSRNPDANAPLGCLRALCPEGPYSEVIEKDAVATAREIGPSTGIPHWHQRGPTPEPLSPSAAAFYSTLYPGTDPLAAYRMYNAALSPLCRLPDDVLLRIMCFLDEDKKYGWLDIMCLRRTSRLFLRLFSRAEFQHLHDTTGFFTTSSYYTDTSETASTRAPVFLPWKAQAHISTADMRQRDNVELWYKLGKRLRGENFEKECYKKYRVVGEVYQHCYACEADHPVRFFSRTKYGKSGKACIAHEGHVRLCLHKTVKLHDVLKSSLTAGSRLGDGVTFHFSPGEKNEYDLRFTPPTGQGTDPSTTTPDLRIVCDHPSHRPEHHISLDPRPSGIPMQAAGTADSPFPSFIVHNRVIRGIWYKVATWSYTAHVDLSGLGDADPANRNGPLTAEAFRSCIEKLRSGHSPARYIAPEDHPGILQELRCVDPNRCGCLHYPGLPRPEQSTEKDYRGRGRRKTFRCQTHAVSRTLYTRNSEVDQIHVRLASCEEDATSRKEDECSATAHHPRCLKIYYTRTIRLQGCHLDHAPMRGLMRYENNRLDVVYRMLDAVSENYAPYGWIQALDVDHLKRISNWEGCQHRRCKMNRNYIRPFVGWGQELNVVCLNGCQWTKRGKFAHLFTESDRHYHFSFPVGDQWGLRAELSEYNTKKRREEDNKALQASGNITLWIESRKVQTVYVKEKKG